MKENFKGGDGFGIYIYLIPIMLAIVLIFLPLYGFKVKRAYTETRKTITTVNLIEGINKFGQVLYSRLKIRVADEKIEKYNFHAQNLNIKLTYYGIKSAHIFTFLLSIPIAYTIIRINKETNFIYGCILGLVVCIAITFYPSIYLLSKKERKKSQWKQGLDMLEALTIFVLRQTYKANNSNDTVGGEKVGSVKFSEYLEIIAKNCPEYSAEFEKALRVYMTSRKEGLRYIFKILDIPEGKKIVTIASAIDDKGAGNIAELLQDLRDLRNSLKESSKKTATQHLMAVMIVALGIPFGYGMYYLVLPWVLALGSYDIKLN